jgi:hypothetical protein
MPRPAKRRQTVIVTVAMELELARKLSALAREYGISRSELIERLIIEALGPRALEPAKPQIPSDPLSSSESPDPLVQLEAEEFDVALAKLESETARLEETVKAVAAGGHLVRTGFEPHRQELRERVWNTIEKWNKMKKWYRALKRDLPREKSRDYSQRLVQVKRKLNGMLGLLGYERAR